MDFRKLSEPNAMLKISGNILKDNGFLVVSTGSRILVRKKPDYYIDDSVVDTHQHDLVKTHFHLF